ncbi:hemopexin repeat-containing protein [Nonomuraea typhae]|uniref:Hemopexin repeat-containing protein n=1 Tax=Nonomuraea typhae TaxID=2603600 RepID=A0ABW7Z5Z4_9ACTN
MHGNGPLPSYAQLFGELDFREGDEARTVCSPAAYLVELLRLMEGAFGRPAVLDRRPDLREIPLDHDNTFTPIPYLDIVNRVLENRTDKARPYDKLLGLKHPLILPFSLEHERVKNHLRHLGVDPVEFARLFEAAPDHDLAARLRLGLSGEDVQVIVTPVSGANAVKALYGLENRDAVALLQEPERFRAALGLSGAELGELLGLPGVRASVDAGRTALQWDGAGNAVPNEWLERVNRFVRLARRTGWSLTELCLVLRTCNEARVDAAAVRIAAAVKHLGEAADLTVTEVCALLTRGVPEEDDPLAALGAWGGDLLGAHNKRYRADAARVTGLAADELTEIVTAYRARSAEGPFDRARSAEGPFDRARSAEGPFDREGEAWAALSLLRRIGRLAAALGLAAGELLQLMDALDSDPALHRHPAFPTLSGGGPDGRDCFRVLDDGTPGAALWLVETLQGVVAWMREAGLGAQDLAAVLDGPPEEAGERQALLTALADRFEQVALEPRALVCERFGPRAAQVLHEILTGHAGAVVSPRDPRLLRLDPAGARAAAYEAVHDLGVLTAGDLTGLGLGERLAAKIFTNLVLNGFLDAGGVLAEPIEDRPLARDFSAHAAAVAALVTSGGGELYPSDLASLGELSESERAELYDNLVHNGVVDADGMVRTGAPVEAGVDLDDVEEAVLGVLRERAERFSRTPLVADLGRYGGLDPVPSLRFNGYLDADGAYLDKGALARTRVEDFTLALEFYPHRRAILEAAQEQIARFRAQSYAFTAEDFAEVADAAMAVRVLDTLAAAVGAEAGEVALADLDATLGPVRAPADGGTDATSEAEEDLTEEEEGFAGSEEDLVEDESDDEFDDDLDDEELWKGEWEGPAPEGDLDAPEEAAGKETPAGEDSGAGETPAGEDAEAGETPAGEDSGAGETPEAGTAVTARAAPAHEPGPVAALLAGAGFTAQEAATAEGRIGEVRAGQQAYHLDPGALTALGFDDDERDRLLGLLIDRGDLDDHLAVPMDRLAAFGRISSALDYRLEGLEDYEKDVFFLLHAAATQTAAAVTEVVQRLEAQQGRQRKALFDVLQDALAVPAATAEAIAVAITGSRDDALDVLVPPALAGAADTRFRLAHRRVRRFALLAAKLGLDPAAVAVAFHDQDLVGKFPEPLALPPDLERVDALLESADGHVYVFTAGRYLLYLAGTLARADDLLHPLTDLSPRFAALTGVDAAFVLPGGEEWLVAHDAGGGTHTFTRQPGVTRWLPREQTWGKIANAFDDPAGIDSAHVDAAGHVHLETGGQCVRYSGTGLTHVDEGFPRAAGERADARFYGGDGRTYTFTGDTWRLDPAGETGRIADTWGRVRNAFDAAERIDAAYSAADGVHLFRGDQEVRYTDCVENDGVRVDDGYPRRTGGPARAAFADARGIVHRFHDGLATSGDGPAVPVAERWGVLPAALPSGTADAALAGLDGRTYLFSGEKYIRYSGADYTVTDLGYPRGIAGDWAGLTRVDAAFVLDGRTYLFGDGRYVRYSGRDYTVADEGYPKPASDNWWNLPEPMAVDAVFTGRDNLTYLFSGGRFVVHDHRRRWWSEPRTLAGDWDSLPFRRVDSAFVGMDGRTYVFGEGSFVRYSTADYTQVDDGYPAPVTAFWGNVASNLARTGRVDATLVTEASELVDGVQTPRRHTYLFSGDQYVRYTGDRFAVVDDGYPRALAQLRTEPRLANLNVVLDGVDAAFADRRNVYLFRGDRCHVVSDTLHRRYDGVAVDCAFLEDGALMAERDGAWWHLPSVEGTGTATPARPRALRAVPEAFRGGLDAVLTGADGTTYLFKGASCYNTRLAREYPLAEEWGHPHNRIFHDNTVDAAFLGRDGRTYLFSGDQFVSSTGTETVTDTDPRPIAAHWGGLTSVTLAYVRNGTTYLFEKPDAGGKMRYVTFTGADYTDPGHPMTADAGFWDVPGHYRIEGHPIPDAVLYQGQTMILLYGRQCVQYDEAGAHWSYPRPIERIWPGHDRGVEPGDALRTAFTGADGATYFFFRHAYTRYGEPAAPIRERWGRSRNPFIRPGDTVDAAVVAGRHTYLFSGGRYVRYTGAEYRYVDPGYPKPVAPHLRGEPAFANLPDTFDDALGPRVDAVLANPRNVYVFTGGACHVASGTAAAAGDLTGLGRVRNTLAERGRVDAALVEGAHTYLFSGDQYVRYTGAAFETVDDGYPRTIAPGFADELRLGELPAEFQDGLDAAFLSPAGVHLFKGENFWHRGRTAPIAGRWGRVRSEFTGALDAAFATPSGEVHAFRGRQYVRYPPGALDVAGEGYPRTIAHDWGDLPSGFESGIEAAFTLHGRTYLLKGAEFVRYSGADLTRVDRTFPQAVRHRWADAADYRLSDVRAIAAFARLCKARPGLAEFLEQGGEDPYAFLSGLFGWDLDEVRWARRNTGLLHTVTAEEARFEIEFLLRLERVFDVAGRMGAEPSRLYAEIWQPLRGGEPATAANGLEALLGRRPDAKTLVKTVHDELNALKRDALVAHVAAGRTTRELFEELLIDVEMGTEGTTTPVREAIAATQLFIHRYLLDLEQVSLPAGRDPGEVRRRIRTWWAWMRNYRVWEGNRRVFLHPENYLVPELREAKTPGFKVLEDDLLQGEITEAGVQAAYKRYLDEYTEVSRLAIAGGYVYTADGALPGERRLVLFGRTRTAPIRYYVREAEFRDRGRLSATWQPWRRVGVQIEVEKVYPVHAFGRVFVFWPVVETVPPPVTGTTTISEQPKDGKREVSAPPPTYRVKICYSFSTLADDWVPAQELPVDVRRGLPIIGVSLFARASATVPGQPEGEHDTIVITCVVNTAGKEEDESFVLTPELYATRAAVTVPASHATELAKIFDEQVGAQGMVYFDTPVGSADEPWLSVDHKGGSFLCRPITTVPADEPAPRAISSAPGELPAWKRVDAAFELPNGDRYFFDNEAKRYTALSAAGETIAEGPTAGRWGLIRTNLLRTGVVDAALVRGNQVYLFSGDEYYRFTGPAFGTLDDDCPRPLAGNDENLPQWPRIVAAFTGPGQTEYFLSAQDGFAQTGSLGMLRPLPSGRQTAIRRFLRHVSGLEDPNPRVAFAFGGRTYVFDNEEHTYTDGEAVHRTRDLGRRPTAITVTGGVDAAYVTGGRLHLTSRLQVVTYTLGPGDSIPDHVDGPPADLQAPVDAVFRRYVFSGPLYGRLAPGQDLATLKPALPVAGNWRALPQGPISGVLDAEDTLYVFSGEHYLAHPKGAPVPRPYEYAAQPHEIVRLTTSTAYELNRRLLTGGVPALLHPETQEIDELPAFTADPAERATATTVKLKPEIFPNGVPAGSHLDFQSANGLYYWEIFFHAPLLIAKALNAAQRHEEARRWYEYIFDPSEPGSHWRFVPFLAADVAALVTGIRTDLAELGETTTPLGTALEPHLARLEPLDDAFLQFSELGPDDLAFLDDLATVRPAVPEGGTPATREAARRLRERLGMMRRLGRQYRLMGDRGALLKAYLDDPFDPHAIAELRPSTYRRNVVMAYIDNLIDWGDQLFRKYTAEDVDEARMLYILAHDLLGERDFGYGPRELSAALPYERLPKVSEGRQLAELTAGGTLVEGAGAVHAGVAGPYFYVPENAVFGEYWSRVADRLRKIRQSLDFFGVSRPVPLFEPPADVMALVRGAAEGAAPDGVAAAAEAAVPHYRFPVVLKKAQELADRVRQFGGDLLSAIERRDGEEMTLLQNRQQNKILDLTRAIKEAEVRMAAENLSELEAGKAAAGTRLVFYERLIAAGLTATQKAQLAIMSTGAAGHFAASGLKIAASLASGGVQVLAGPFIMGVEYGADQLGGMLDTAADISSTMAEGFSVLGEVLAVTAEHERMAEEWELQRDLAKSDLVQLEHQINGAKLRAEAARQELRILEQELAHGQEIAGFLTAKFSGAQLYRWMTGRLSGMYFTAYGLAFDMAKAAERAYAYENGGGSGEPYVKPVYWDSRRNGLLAGESLALDLDRLGAAYLQAGRELEITKRISLLGLDPLALLTLRDTGRCEFSLGEALFDRDFPGHYRRRVRNVAVAFEADAPVSAVLTQLAGRTVLEPDPKAVKFLLDPKGTPPATLRADLRAGQRIALSHVAEGQENNGLFDLRYDDDRYLPFEGCGAVSTWLLEIPGRRPQGLRDVVVTLRYTAEPGGEAFTNAVRGMQRPYAAARYVDVAAEFPEQWEEFLLAEEAGPLLLPLTAEHFPGLIGGQITGLCARYDLDGGSARFLVNGERRYALDHGKAIRAAGLGVGAPWALVVEGDKNALVGVGLVLTYRAQ